MKFFRVSCLEFRVNLRPGTQNSKLTLRFIKCIYSGLDYLPIYRRRRAAEADAADALAVDGDRQATFDTDKISRAHSEGLR
jgi:hypothetical protein